MIVKCVILALVASVVTARTTSTNQNSIAPDEHQARSTEGTSFYGDMRYLFKVYQECSAVDLSSCLKLKLVAALDRVARSTDFSIFNGITFVKDDSVPTGLVKSEAEIEASLPRSLEEKDDALNTMLTDKVSNFFDTHSLQVKLPSMSDLQRSFSDEARKRKGGKGGGGAMMLLPLILGGTLIPLALGALALLAGKALLVSKLALVLAGIIGLKKLLGGGDSHHDSGHEVVVSGGHGGHSGWSRSYDKEQAQNLAYNAYVQKSR